MNENEYGLTEYHAKYFAYELTKRSSSDSIDKLAASLSDAQVDLNPHQIEAALFAFRSPLSKGAVLADEVGLGKTIEAGIVISQKWAERKRKILIIVPANLRKQWNEELMDKFFIQSIILEKGSFNEEISKGNLNPLNQEDKIIICSYHFARAKDVYIKQTKWDLIIIDEAHRLRNVYKPSNKIANAIKEAVREYPKILLTATPLQNSLLELFGLVSVVDEKVFGDIDSFKALYCKENLNFDELKDRIRPICQRTLRRQVLEYISYTNRMAITQEFFPTEDEQKLYNLVTTYLQRPLLYALPASQRHLMTLILRKLLASSTYAIAGTLAGLASKLEFLLKNQHKPEVVEEILQQELESYDELKEEWVDDEEEEDSEEKPKAPPQLTEKDIENIKEEIVLLREMHKTAQKIIKNSKGEVLLTALHKGFAEATKKGAPKKAVIFTESRRTQMYLFDILSNTEYAGKVVLFSGTNNHPMVRQILAKWLEKNKDTDRITNSKTANIRAALVDCFRDDATILVATEAAAEGINLQFCSLVVNYDLPWNPQRIEQRIGRCHRYGQKHDVVVVNFLNKKNAADQRVYELLEQKFCLFSGVFGASDEVLGAIESGIDFERRIADIYQNCRTEEEIQRSFDALQNELEEKISEKVTQTKQRLLESFDEEVAEKLRINMLQSKECLGKFEHWLWSLTKFYLREYAKFDEEEKNFFLVKNPFPEEAIHPGPYRLGKNIEDAHIYRPNHPLAQRLIERCKAVSTPLSHLVFDYSGKKISILESLVGKSGWLFLQNLTISAFEQEDYIIYCAVTDEGRELGVDYIPRIFSLPARYGIDVSEPSLEVKQKIRQVAEGQKVDILERISTRNAGFFDKEMEKLEKWAEDLKESMEIAIKDFDRQIKAQKTEAKKILALEEKVKTQRGIKELEKKRNAMRVNYFKEQDAIETRKEELIAQVESRLKQDLSEKEVFLVRWSIK